MENVTMHSLLKADEARLRMALSAGRAFDQDREACVRSLSDEFSSALLRYNAACADAPLRQTVADGLTATAKEALQVLNAAEAETAAAPRSVRPRALYLLLAAVALGAVALPLLQRVAPAGAAALVLALGAAFAAGRLWYTEQRVTARATLSPEALWSAALGIAQTMDRKCEEFDAQAETLERERARQSAAEAETALPRESLRLFGDLLEAAYAQNGEFALRQLEKLRPYLRENGIEVRDYAEEDAALFEVLPAKRGGRTLRPALVRGKHLLLRGRATKETGA